MPDDSTAPPRPPLGDRLGPADGERPRPRFTGVMGAAGGFLAVFGVFTLLTELPDDGRRVATGAVALLLIVAGALLLQSSSAPATSAAGVTAFAAGFSPLMLAVAVDPDSVVTASDTRTFLVLVTVAWLVAWLAGPARGHALLLGLALWGGWILIATATDDAPFLFPGAGALTFVRADEIGGSGGGNSAGALSLIVAAVYLWTAVVLDRRGRRALATPFVAVAHVAWLSGLVALWSLEATSVATLALGVSVAVAAVGVALGRRFTAWLGALVMAVATAALVWANLHDDPVVAGLLLLAAGAAVVLVAYLLGPGLGEVAPPTAEEPGTPVA